MACETGHHQYPDRYEDRGPDPWQRAKTLILLNELIDDEDFTPGELEEFIAEARTVAEQIASDMK